MARVEELGLEGVVAKPLGSTYIPGRRRTAWVKHKLRRVECLAMTGAQYGARPLRRAIQRLLEDELSERLLAGEIEPGQRVRIDLRDGRLHVETVPEAEAVRLDHSHN